MAFLKNSAVISLRRENNSAATSPAVTANLAAKTYRLFIGALDRNRVSTDFYDLPINPGHVRVLYPNLGSHRNGSLRRLQEHSSTLNTSHAFPYTEKENDKMQRLSNLIIIITA